MVRALVCERVGDLSGLVVRDMPAREPRAGQVAIRVKAAGVNFPDVLTVRGRYQLRRDPPFVPGGEVAGVIDAVGEGVENLKVGDRVTTMAASGAFAERTVAAAAKCLPLPDDMDFAVGAGFVANYGTALHVLRNSAAMQPGERLVVLGAAGGTGLAAVEVGKVLGARVLGCVSSEARAAEVMAHGADDIVVYPSSLVTPQDRAALTKALLDKTGGVDVVCDPVGASYVVPVLRAMARLGRYVVVGFAGSDEVPSVPLNLPLLRQCSIVGSLWGEDRLHYPERDRRDLEDLFRWWGEGRLKPQIVMAGGLDAAVSAMQDLVERRVIGKLVITP